MLCRRRVSIKKRDNLATKKLGKSRRTVKEPTNLSRLPTHQVFWCFMYRNKPLSLFPGSIFVILFIISAGNKEGSRNGNCCPDAVRDVSGDHTKRVSVQQFVSNHGTSERVRMGRDKEEERKRRSFNADL